MTVRSVEHPPASRRAPADCFASLSDQRSWCHLSLPLPAPLECPPDYNNTHSWHFAVHQKLRKQNKSCGSKTIGYKTVTQWPVTHSGCNGARPPATPAAHVGAGRRPAGRRSGCPHPAAALPRRRWARSGRPHIPADGGARASAGGGPGPQHEAADAVLGASARASTIPPSGRLHESSHTAACIQAGRLRP